MAMRVLSENAWGCELKSTNKTCSWRRPDHEVYEYKLFLSQASLGAQAKEDERNVVEATATTDDGSICHTILSLRCGLLEACGLNLGFVDDVTFTLVSGSGPIHIVGTVLEGISDENLTNKYIPDEDVSNESIDEEEEDLTDQDSREVCCKSNKSHSDECCNGMHTCGCEEDSDSKENGMDVSSEDEDDDSDGGEQNGDNDDDDESHDDEEEDDDESHDDEENESDDDNDDVGDNDDGDEDEDDYSDPSIEEVPKKVEPKLKKGVLKSKAAQAQKKEKKVTFSLEKKQKKQTSADAKSLIKSLSAMKNLPKTQQKFTNFLKSNMKVKDEKIISEVWNSISKNKKN